MRDPFEPTAAEKWDPSVEMREPPYYKVRMRVFFKGMFMPSKIAPEPLSQHEQYFTEYLQNNEGKIRNHEDGRDWQCEVHIIAPIRIREVTSNDAIRSIRGTVDFILSRPVMSPNEDPSNYTNMILDKDGDPNFDDFIPDDGAVHRIEFHDAEIRMP